MMSGASWGEASLFVAAAHDLKSPLALLRQLALSLEAGGLSPVEVAELARRMALTSERALRLTTDLTQSTRLHEELFGIEPLNLALVVRDVVAELGPTRLGHGVRASEDPALLDEVVAAGISLEVCPASNVSLGVYSEASGVPVRTLMDAGATIALGADDPLLFLSRLTAQYETLREQGFDDAELAALASSSVEASFADEASKRAWKAEIQDWLAADPSNETEPLNDADPSSEDDAEADGARSETAHTPEEEAKRRKAARPNQVNPSRR